MAKCPRCALPVPPYTRCSRCGLVLGFDGITVLIEFEDSPQFERARRIAIRQKSCSEWVEENGRRMLRVTYSLAELDQFRRFAPVAAKLSRKHSFLNGLEVRWPEADACGLLWEGFPPPLPVPSQHHGRSSTAPH